MSRALLLKIKFISLSTRTLFCLGGLYARNLLRGSIISHIVSKGFEFAAMTLLSCLALKRYLTMYDLAVNYSLLKRVLCVSND